MPFPYRISRAAWLTVLAYTCSTASLMSFAQSTQAVEATETANHISVNNGLIDIEVSRVDGVISAIRKFDGKNWHDLGVTAKKASYGERSLGEDIDPETAMYWDANADVPVVPAGLKPLKKGYYRASAGHNETKLTEHTPDRAEVTVTTPPSPLFPFAVDVHYTVFRGQSGFYAYAVLHHDQTQPAATLYQTRFVIKTIMDGTFDQWAVGNDKFVPIPQADIVKQLTDATFLLADGTVKTKYLNSIYWAQVPVYGYTGKHFGLWMVEPSPEYHNGGPIKQGQTVHDNVLLRVLQSVHFGASPVQLAPGELWTKTYGPFLVYANEGNGAESLWSDAAAQLKTQASAWPYNWVNSPAYDHARGALEGHVQLGSGHAAGAWAILSPTDKDWSAESKGYNFWTRIDTNGHFAIDKIVPGKYTLFLSGADQPTDFSKQEVLITANQKLDLGTLTWTPVTHGTQIFQLGTFDHSAEEFRNGSGARSYQMFQLYPKQFPHDVDFSIGTSDPARDWNYTHWTLYSEHPEWKLRFNTHASEHGKATLTVGFASSQPAQGKLTDLRIAINGSEIAQVHLPKTGTAGYRGGVQDSPYNLRVIDFPASLLHEGENILTFRHADAKPFQQFIPDASSKEVPANGAPGQVMYDAIRLEVEP